MKRKRGRGGRKGMRKEVTGRPENWREQKKELGGRKGVIRGVEEGER